MDRDGNLFSVGEQNGNIFYSISGYGRQEFPQSCAGGCGCACPGGKSAAQGQEVGQKVLDGTAHSIHSIHCLVIRGQRRAKKDIKTDSLFGNDVHFLGESSGHAAFFQKNDFRRELPEEFGQVLFAGSIIDQAVFGKACLPDYLAGAFAVENAEVTLTFLFLPEGF